MRFKDHMSMFGTALAIGFAISAVFYFIWSDAYLSTNNSFWFSWFGTTILSIPVGYSIVKKSSTCPSCDKSFVMSENGQTDIENFLKYKNESVTENGVTRNKNVPYNVRRYYQHMKCDSCGHTYKYEAKSESKA